MTIKSLYRLYTVLEQSSIGPLSGMHLPPQGMRCRQLKLRSRTLHTTHYQINKEK